MLTLKKSSKQYTTYAVQTASLALLQYHMQQTMWRDGCHRLDG